MASPRTSFLVLVGIGACAATAVVAREVVTPPGGSSRISDSPKEVIDQTWQIVFRDYLDINGKYKPDQWRQMRRDVLAKSYGNPKEAYEAIRGMLGSLDDPYTRFLDPREFKEMQIDTSGELSGVGIQLSLDKETKNLVVVSPIEGSPASRAGVQPKDVIVAIDGVSRNRSVFVHSGRIERGSLAVGDLLNAQVDRACRRRAQANHTATHLLQAALKQVVDPGIGQAGSLVTFDRLRFDFHCPRAVAPVELEQIETLINGWISDAHRLEVQEMAIEAAKAAGDLGKVRHLEEELQGLKEFKEHHPEDSHDPSPLEVYCDLNPAAPECRVYDD